MELYPLHVFLTVANEKSFSRAAEKLFRTQPAVSLALQRLESTLGEKLIERNAKDMVLTDAGRAVLDYARRFENLTAELTNALAELRDNSAGRLTIGATAPTASIRRTSAPSEEERCHGLVSVVIAAVVACFLLLAILLYSFRENIGRSLISLGQKLSAPSETSQAEPPDTKPAEAAQQPAPTNGTKENNPAPQSQATSSAAEKPEAIQPREDREKTASPPTKAEPTFKDERPGPSTEESAAKDTRNLSPAEQVRELWSQVGQGNTSAEVTLAKLYLIGGGVTKNCDQARVLLRAAAKKGNPEAIAKLSQITRQGCP